MNDIRSKFEEIWPVPDGIGWNTDHGRYMVFGRSSLSSGIAAVEYQARLDTFTRCQESMGPVLSLVEEMMQEIESCHADLRKENWYVPRESDLLNRAKQFLK